METKLYEKINKVKLALAMTDIKKSGKNTFTKYNYMELGDFLPTLIKIMHDNKLTSMVSFTADTATLKIIDAEDGEVVESTSSLVQAELKGSSAIQMLGASQTYLRRYLYMNAFDIVEGDIIDANTGKNEKDNKPKEKKVESNPGDDFDTNRDELFDILDEYMQKAADIMKKDKESFYLGYEKKYDQKREQWDEIRIKSMIDALKKEYE